MNVDLKLDGEAIFERAKALFDGKFIENIDKLINSSNVSEDIKSNAIAPVDGNISSGVSLSIEEAKKIIAVVEHCMTNSIFIAGNADHGIELTKEMLKDVINISGDKDVVLNKDIIDVILKMLNQYRKDNGKPYAITKAIEASYCAHKILLEKGISHLDGANLVSEYNPKNTRKLENYIISGVIKTFREMVERNPPQSPQLIETRVTGDNRR
jgi:hypothetical protein